MSSKPGWAVLAAMLALAPAARAATSTTNLSVGVTIVAGCSVSVTNIVIGSIVATRLSTSQRTTPAAGGLLTYACAPGAGTPSLGAGQGANYINNSNNMKGAATGRLLPYYLNLPTLANAAGVSQTAQISAVLPVQPTLPAIDTYSDNVLLTLTY